MSFAIFEIQKYIIEKYISEYRHFLTHKLRNYKLEDPDLEMLNEQKEKVEEEFKDKYEKSIEDCMNFILTDSWKTVFKADNIVDTGKTLDEQAKILQDTIFSLDANNVLDNKHFTDDIVQEINTKFLCDGYKFYVLKALLVAEYNLCNKNISYIDAICERVRVMYYSLLLVTNMDKVEDLLEIVNRKESKLYIPKHIVNLLKLPIIRDYIRVDQVSVVDILYASALCSIICGPSDDYLDLEEDLQNNKITGMTQAVKEGIDPKTIVATTIKFLKDDLRFPEFPEFRKWAVHVMLLLYKDTPKCLEFCKSISPEYFSIVFQRKTTET